MIQRYSYDDLNWIDINDPSREEIRNIMEEYGVNPDIANELINPSVKPHIALYDDFIYLVINIPAVKHSHAHGQKQEIDFIIGHDTLITVHYDLIDPIHKFSKEFEAESVIHNHEMGEHAGYIFYHLIKKLYKSVEHELEYIDSNLKDIEEKIFSGKEKKMVRTISEVSRELLDIERTLDADANVLETLEVAGTRFFGEDFAYPLQRIRGIHQRVHDQITRQREMVGELRDTNDSLVSTKQNEVMKILTIMAFVTFPLSLLASLFGMNTIATPIVGTRYDFWIIVGAMVLLTGFFFVYFKYKRWL